MANPSRPTPTPSGTTDVPLPPANGGSRDYGILNNIIQPNYSWTEDQYGLLQGTIMKYHNAVAPAGVTVVSKGTPHPLDARLKAYKSSINFQKNGGAYITTDYIGLKKDPTDPEWDVSSNTAETSILFHPRIGEFAVLKAGTGKNPIDSVTWKTWVECEPNSNKFKNFSISAPGGLAGVSKYLIPRGAIRYTFYTARNDIVGLFMTNLSTWSATPKYAPKEVLPASKATYLLQSVGVTPFGSIYKVSCEWQLSEHGEPWNIYIYPEFGSQSGGSGGWNRKETSVPL